MIKINKIIEFGTLIMMILSLWLVFIYAPTEKTMGIVQRIFYFHVPSAWIAFLAFGIVFIYSILFLWKQNKKFDTIASSAAEIGVVFTSIVLITGPIWAKPVWNTWWTWDPRLTTTLILWLIYVAYLMLRIYAEDEELGSKYSSVFGIVGFIDVPIVYMSIRWWRTIHPKPVIMGGEGSGLDAKMQLTLLICTVTFTLLFFWLLNERIRLQFLKDEITNLRQNLSDLRD